LIEAACLTRRYPNGRGVFDVSLRVEPGEVLGVIGENGSGKTTLVRVLATLEAPTSGRLAWFGLEDRRSPAVRRRLGVALDRPVHFEALTGRQNAEFFAAQYGRLDARRLDRLFDWASLAEARDLPVSDYSLGMRRRLSLVEALCHDPQLLVLDEPSLALDAGGEIDLGHQLRQRAAAGAAVLLATNDLQLAQAVCDSALELCRGEACLALGWAQSARRATHASPLQCGASPP
jgi:ABC-type multidrug transport system ATPase subunit